MSFYKLLIKKLTLLAGVCIVVSACAENDSNQKSEKVIPRHLLFGNPVKTSPRLSPDGSLLAYVAPDNQNVLNVWIRNLREPNSKDYQLTNDNKRGIREFLWQFDNQHILYLQDEDGDENWHIFQTSLSTGETKPLTPFKGAKAAIVKYNHKLPNEILVKINERNKKVFDVYRIDLTTGESKIDTEDFAGAVGWYADNNSQVRLAITYAEDGGKIIHIRDNKDSPWKEFLRTGSEDGQIEIAGFSEDNQFLYVLSALEANTTRLLKFNVLTGEKEVIATHPQYDITEVMVHPTTRALEAAGVETDRFEWIQLDPTIASDLVQLQKLSKDGFSKIVSRDLTNQNWVVGTVSDQRPTRFYLYHRADQSAEFLFTTMPELDKYEHSKMTPISFSARDGLQIYGYLSLPVGKEPKNLPMVLYVHGGPWVRDSWGFNPTVQWLTNRGYAVLQLNYRGSSGYGKEHLNAGNKEWSGKMQTDLLDGKQWAIAQGYTDPNKVAIFGGSYGGYATLVGLAFTPEEFCCGVDVVGPSNLISLLQTVPPYWTMMKAHWSLTVGDLDTEQEFLKSCSPFFKAHQINKPLLIGQGANDPRVKQSESDQIVAEMRKNNLPVEYILFPDEGHGFAQPANRMRFNAAMECFLNKYLGGTCQPPSAEENWNFLLK